MNELHFDELDFPLGWCVGCAREVLTCAGDDEGIRHCVHCTADIAGPLRQLRGAELGERGYALHEEQGCGKADCGGGRCGTRS